MESILYEGQPEVNMDYDGVKGSRLSHWHASGDEAQIRRTRERSEIGQSKQSIRIDGKRNEWYDRQRIRTQGSEIVMFDRLQTSGEERMRREAATRGTEDSRSVPYGFKESVSRVGKTWIRTLWEWKIEDWSLTPLGGQGGAGERRPRKKRAAERGWRVMSLKTWIWDDSFTALFPDTMHEIIVTVELFM